MSGYVGQMIVEDQKQRIAELEAERDKLQNQLQNAHIGIDIARKERDRLRDTAEFYETRCNALYSIQKRMRDPERQMVCDILANGTDRESAGIGKYLAAKDAEIARLRKALNDVQHAVQNLDDPRFFTVDSIVNGINEVLEAIAKARGESE